MGRIFGTDGARGVAGEGLSAELALNIGRAAAQVLAAECGHRPLVVIGMDTRISGDMLQAATTAGLCSVGADVLLLGVVPTPAVAYLVGYYKADAGVMISASHNPYEFNGIKLFGPSGFKLTDEEEESIEAIVLDGAIPYDVKKGELVGKVSTATDAVDAYIKHLTNFYKGGYSGRILVDCANGSASVTARKLFGSLKINADYIFDAPNGININDKCGSTHIELLAKRVWEGGYDAGFAFDGDADRLLVVDEKGKILDGDFILAALTGHMSRENTLKNNSVAVTTMSNMGFFKLMEQRGITVETTKVGDRYVLEAMREKGICLGGEASGHIILLDWASTGDGQLSALALLNAITGAKLPLSELVKDMKSFPQIMVNVTATPSMKAALDVNPLVTGEISCQQKLLGEKGRILVRASGTEPYIRVMAEGEDMAKIKKAVSDIATAIKEHLI